MIYINSNCNGEIPNTLFIDLLKKIKSISNDKTDYHIQTINNGYSIIGVIKMDDTSCLIDMYNHKINGKDFFLWLKNVLSHYDDFYCVPNKNGEIIWKSLGIKNYQLYLSFQPLSLFKKEIKFRFVKFLFLNMFFELTTKKSLLKLNRKIFFNKKLPKHIKLDTF